MSERISRIERLVEMLEAGLTTRVEYDELKQGGASDGSSSGQELSDTSSTFDIPSTIAREVRRLKDRGEQGIGVTTEVRTRLDTDLESIQRAWA